MRQQVGLKKLVNCLQIISRHLAALAISNEFVRDLLTFAKVAHASTLYSADVHECVGSAVIRLNEAKALGGVEELDCMCFLVHIYNVSALCGCGVLQ